MWLQREISLRPPGRGFHLVTRDVVGELPELGGLRVGLLHLFMLHTSASLTLNENASADVRRDFESYFNDAVPEDAPYWTHTDEGPDDMPAHVKASLLGPSLSLPIASGRLALGTWQGIYLCEHRDRGGARPLTARAAGRAGRDRGRARAGARARRGDRRPAGPGDGVTRPRRPLGVSEDGDLAARAPSPAARDHRGLGLQER